MAIKEVKRNDGADNSGELAGVDLAYGFVHSSYELVERRLQAVELRIQILLGLVGGLTVAAPIFAAYFVARPDFSHGLFYSAIGVFSVLSVVGLVTLVLGAITLVNPRILHEGWLHLSEADFKENMISTAGKHFDDNT